MIKLYICDYLLSFTMGMTAMANYTQDDTNDNMIWWEPIERFYMFSTFVPEFSWWGWHMRWWKTGFQYTVKRVISNCKPLQDNLLVTASFCCRYYRDNSSPRTVFCNYDRVEPYHALTFINQTTKRQFHKELWGHFSFLERIIVALILFQ